MKDEILKWFAVGETGSSSKVMAFQLLGLPHDKNYPCDPADFNRCLKFLEAVPVAKVHMDKISRISEYWERLVKNWTEIEQCFLDEVGLNWCKGQHLKAEKTYRLMEEVLSGQAIQEEV